MSQRTFRPATAEAIDSIDAALYTGDEFVADVRARQELRATLQRWLRKLDEHRDLDV